MNFKFYVVTVDFNTHKPKMFNIFDNIKVQRTVEDYVKKYVKAPGRYKTKLYPYDEKEFVGFDALCEDIRSAIMWEEWSRCEYEVLVGELCSKDVNELEKIDAYYQALPNIEIIARECIYQYKKYIKESKNK